tara:strand:- start:299 stop:1198 length:900 start_codon:yes stop_codon:yes gene_type:complete
MQFNKNHFFKYGEIETVSPGIRRLTANNPSSFTFYGTGTYIVGHESAVIIDPGPADPKHLNILINDLGSKNISAILVTHNHPDHVEGVDFLRSKCGAPVYAYKNPSNNEEECINGNDKVLSTFSPDIYIDDEEIINLDEVEIECIHTPGHTSDHVCFAIPNTGNLFCGDHVMAWSTSVIMPPDGNLGDYINSLKKLLQRDDSCFWPTHGPPIQEPKDYVRQLIDHRFQRIDQIIELLKTGSFDIIQLSKRLYPNLSNNLVYASHQSTYASLLFLISQKKVLALNNAGLETKYSLVEIHN